MSRTGVRAHAALCAGEPACAGGISGAGTGGLTVPGALVRVRNVRSRGPDARETSTVETRRNPFRVRSTRVRGKGNGFPPPRSHPIKFATAAASAGEGSACGRAAPCHSPARTLCVRITGSISSASANTQANCESPGAGATMCTSAAPHSMRSTATKAGNGKHVSLRSYERRPRSIAVHRCSSSDARPHR